MVHVGQRDEDVANANLSSSPSCMRHQFHRRQKRLAALVAAQHGGVEAFRVHYAVGQWNWLHYCIVPECLKLYFR